ncbi:hypothetical protein BN2364_2277 [Alloalcanivorax xenomutans]|nr:hypothetical protein BN2364_2277 [Alloalcanivorax xenomutans]
MWSWLWLLLLLDLIFIGDAFKHFLLGMVAGWVTCMER